MTQIPLTDEQQQAIDLFHEGHSIAIQAGAGTGKTSTLVALAKSTRQRGTYTAFNKSIVVDSQERFPSTVDCKTTHALAYRVVGHRFSGRLSAPRMRSDRIATLLGIGHVQVIVDGKPKTIQPSYLGSLAMRAIANFCASDDRTPTAKHVPYIEGIDPTDGGRRTYGNNDDVSAHIAAVLPDVWSDLCDPGGKLPYKHDAYVKMWEQGKPRIPGDFIMLDEAQDTAPVMASVLRKQGPTQKVLVGDSAQAIYDWRGAVDAFSYLGADQTTYLTQSFRFGDAIADVANLVLGELDSPLRIHGLSTIPSTIDVIEEPDCWLTRTNAVAMQRVLATQRNGKRAYLMGGPGPILAFAKAAADLKLGKPAHHPDLACFETWDELLHYVEDDPQGDELALMVQLIEDHGVEVVIAACEAMPRDERDADVVVSTAHKAKGREWDTVRLAHDFTRQTDSIPGPAELRLLYVACTRAKLSLDPHGSDIVAGLVSDQAQLDAMDATVL